MDNLIKHINQSVRISSDLENIIRDTFKEERIAKQEVLLRANSYVRKLYFVNKGVLRTFYEHDEKEITSWFYPENQFLTSWYGFYRQETSYEYIEALEDCSVYSITYHDYIQLIENHPKFERFSRLLVEYQLTFIDSYSKGYMFMSAKDKYKLLLSNIPDIELRVKLGYIASFLGISQETLSRIRAGK